MERTIKVTGKGKISVKPDTIRLLITQSDVEKVYEDAIKRSAENKGYLNCEIQKVGFSKEDLKTLSFNVDTENEGYHDNQGNWKRRFIGYRYTHQMKLEFPVDNNRLGELLSIVSNCPGKPEFSIEYTVSDPELVKNELLARAVEDSKVKATVLSKAAGVFLKEIMIIDYSWEKIDIVTRPVSKLMSDDNRGAIFKMNSADLDIEADDIDVSDTVTVVWRIE